jgi:hypothetical protein
MSCKYIIDAFAWVETSKLQNWEQSEENTSKAKTQLPNDCNFGNQQKTAEEISGK